MTPEETIKEQHFENQRLRDRILTLEENLSKALEMLHKSMADRDRLAQELHELRLQRMD